MGAAACTCSAGFWYAGVRLGNVGLLRGTLGSLCQV